MNMLWRIVNLLDVQNNVNRLAQQETRKELTLIKKELHSIHTRDLITCDITGSKSSCQLTIQHKTSLVQHL